jgi:hypothetical protein
MRRSIFLVMITIFLAAALSSGVRAEEKETVSYAVVPYGYKTKEQVAFELFVNAFGKVQELRTIGTYSAYLQAYERSLSAVYSEGGPGIRMQAAPAIIEKWENLSPDRRAAITKKLAELIAESK